MSTNQVRPRGGFLSLLVLFIGEFIFYLGFCLVISQRRGIFPSSLPEWGAWVMACIFLFLLPEGLVLLVSIILYVVAVRIGADPSLDQEPETARSTRRLRWLRRLWRAFSLLSYPHLTILAPILVVTGVLEPFLSWLQQVLDTAMHADYHAWIVLALLWICANLAALPLIWVWRRAINALAVEPEADL